MKKIIVIVAFFSLHSFVRGQQIQISETSFTNLVFSQEDFTAAQNIVAADGSKKFHVFFKDSTELTSALNSALSEPINIKNGKIKYITATEDIQVGKSSVIQKELLKDKPSDRNAAIAVALLTKFVLQKIADSTSGTLTKQGINSFLVPMINGQETKVLYLYVFESFQHWVLHAEFIENNWFKAGTRFMFLPA